MREIRFKTAFCSVAMVATSLFSTGLALAGEPRHHERDRDDEQCCRNDNDRHRGEPGFRIRLGLFQPDGNSAFWDETRRGFSGHTSGLEAASVGGEFTWGLSENVELWTGVSAYEGKQRVSYKQFVDADGNEITHKNRLQIVPVTVGVTFFPIGHNTTISPYVGVGGGFYGWRYRESGDFINFDNGDQIFTTAYDSDGVTLGGYLVAGAEARIARDMKLYVEGRWSHASTDPNSGDFSDFGTLDLGGREVNAGLAWRF